MTRIDLPCSIDRVVGIRVKHIAWLTSPITADSTMMWLSSSELLNYGLLQSGFMTDNPALPSSGNQIVNRRDLIASWVVSPSSSKVVNANNNDPQPLIHLPTPISINKISFLLEDDYQGATLIIPDNKVTITVEFTVEF